MNFIREAESVIYAPIDHRENNWLPAECLRGIILKCGVNVFFIHPESKIQGALFPWKEIRESLSVLGFSPNLVTQNLLSVDWIGGEILKRCWIHHGMDVNRSGDRVANILNNDKRIEVGAPIRIKKKRRGCTMSMWRFLKGNCDCYPRSFAHFELLLGSGGGFGRSIGSNLCGFSGFLCFPSYESGESSVENEYKKTPFLNFKFRFLPAFAFLLLGYFFIGKGWRRICDDNR